MAKQPTLKEMIAELDRKYPLPPQSEPSPDADETDTQKGHDPVYTSASQTRYERSYPQPSKPRPKSLYEMQYEREKEPLLNINTAQQWMKIAMNTPPPRLLFGQFWHEGELCILFADTNLGKTILAVQIADSISRGVGTCGFDYHLPPQKVLYCDFELSAKQFEARYSTNYTNHYQFHLNFVRAEINPDAFMPDNHNAFEDYLLAQLQTTIVLTGAKVLVIDNLTYLKSENETAKDALLLMKKLKRMKTEHNLSILVLAHTPKRDLHKPLTRNDLQGSKMLINFCDSAFAIGESHADKSIRYLKQIKARNTEIVFDAAGVYLCRIDKTDSFLHFVHTGIGHEQEHLKMRTPDDPALTDTIKALKAEGNSIRKIADQLGVPHAKVQRILDKG